MFDIDNPPPRIISRIIHRGRRSISRPCRKGIEIGVYSWVLGTNLPLIIPKSAPSRAADFPGSGSKRIGASRRTVRERVPRTIESR
jgi:hypothetical protein